MPCLEQVGGPLPVRAVEAEHSPLHPLPQLLAHHQVLCQLQPGPGLEVGGYTDDLQHAGISQQGLAGGQYTAALHSAVQPCCLASCTGWQQLAESSQGMHASAAKSGNMAELCGTRLSVGHTD